MTNTTNKNSADINRIPKCFTDECVIDECVHLIEAGRGAEAATVLKQELRKKHDVADKELLRIVLALTLVTVGRIQEGRKILKQMSLQGKLARRRAEASVLAAAITPSPAPLSDDVCDQLLRIMRDEESDTKIVALEAQLEGLGEQGLLAVAQGRLHIERTLVTLGKKRGWRTQANMLIGENFKPIYWLSAVRMEVLRYLWKSKAGAKSVAKKNFDSLVKLLRDNLPGTKIDNEKETAVQSRHSGTMPPRTEAGAVTTVEPVEDKQKKNRLTVYVNRCAEADEQAYLSACRFFFGDSEPSTKLMNEFFVEFSTLKLNDRQREVIKDAIQKVCERHGWPLLSDGAEYQVSLDSKTKGGPRRFACLPVEKGKGKVFRSQSVPKLTVPTVG